MLVLRAFLIVAGGFTFIFLPGSLIALLNRKGLRYDRSLLLWGMLVLIIGLLPANFLTTFLRFIIWGEAELDKPGQALVALLGSVSAAIFLIAAQYLILRWRKVSPENLASGGVMLGLGAGLLNKVFLGFVLVGAGMRLLFGDTLSENMSQIAAQPWLSLAINLIALIIDRMAMVTLGAALGMLVARAISLSQARWLGLAILASALFGWLYALTGLAFGNDSIPGNLLIIVYEGGLASLLLRWLIRAGPVTSGVQAARLRTRTDPRVT